MKKILFILILIYFLFAIVKSFSLRWLLHMLAIAFLLLAALALARDIQREYHKSIAKKNAEYVHLLNQERSQGPRVIVQNVAETVCNIHIKEESPDGPYFHYVEILAHEKEAYDAMFQSIKNAKHHIHAEYFIIKNDQIGTKIKNLLIQKKREGLEIRLIYDGFGSLLMQRKYIRELKNAGIEVATFSPLWQGICNVSMNYRNHRKMLIIDGETCMMGGRNIGDEYFGKKTKIGKWKDLDILLKGSGVAQVQSVFLRDWYMAKGQMLMDKKYYKENIENRENIPVQIITGGPDSPQNHIEHAYFSMVNAARKQIFIITPYLIPTESMITALENAVFRGVDVQILIPINSDNLVAKYATNLWAKRLAKSGVKVFQYQNGFIHSKMIAVDDKIASIGTANFDYRGMQRDYEMLAVIYHENYVRQLKAYFQIFMDQSKKIEVEKREGFLDIMGMQFIKLIRESL
ncbi:cardiolipin synthase [Thermotalea metallivorans]|uniref:Cardiolipin synthase n=1 Tax=Thermotalea metallivorans TaxID=520762 RepID=A0A140LB62_9FIRM|nr:cardiolipin synthase [Thermotalea metallivorans]KXG77787.1 Major cardiolipin synthase ClsA [Thermotalea metallivorans]